MLFGACFSLLLSTLSSQQTLAQNTVTHKHIQTIERADLASVCGTTISPDQKFLYASAWSSNSIVICRRDAETGKLEHVDTLNDDEKLHGNTSVDFSPDGKLAVATAFRNHSVSLLKRDARTGKLAFADTSTDGDEVEGGALIQGISWAIDTRISVNGKYAYVANGRDGVASFEITEDAKLKYVDHFLSPGDSMDACREVAVHPKLPVVYAASKGSSAITVMDSNPMSGELTLSQVIRDGEDGVNGIEGVHGLTCSVNGKFLFVASGRFAGDNSVGCYRIDDSGKLTLVNEVINDETDGFSGFEGGNNIVASEDGKSIYASGTRSGVLAAFTQNPETDEISFQEFLKSEMGETDLGMAAGVSISKDGKFVYVGSEENGQVLVFTRDIK